MKVGISQISPVWLDKTATEEKIIQEIKKAAKESCSLLVFGEALLPGYPFWVAYTGGAQFDNRLQKEMYAIYQQNAVNIDGGDLSTIQKCCQEQRLSIYLGTIEKSTSRSGYSLYCSLVFIDARGEIQSVHRKLVPTYEERLVWAPGDGNGLRVHSLDEFIVGGLNCWENWMPLSRTALYAQGENLHIAVWPGSDYNTQEISRFIARESRSFVISACSTLSIDDVPNSLPIYELLQKNAPKVLANGGSCIAKPNGDWLIEPIVNKELLITAELDEKEVARERQNFDPTGHYSRPDILSLNLNAERQSVLKENKTVS